MPHMKTKDEILQMVEKFDKAEEVDRWFSTEASCVRDSLNWVLGHHEDGTLTSWIEE
jgi:hypothetical protein